MDRYIQLMTDFLLILFNSSKHFAKSKKISKLYAKISAFLYKNRKIFVLPTHFQDVDVNLATKFIGFLLSDFRIFVVRLPSTS